MLLFMMPMITKHAPLHAQVTLGLGCFWEPSEELLKVPGITSTTCGYAGGSARPTYQSVCAGDGHVEAVKIEYDGIELEDVLDAAFLVAKPSNKRQYNPVIFTNDERAEKWRNSGKKRKDGFSSKMFTIEDAPFWKAEEYHQDFWLKWRPRIAVLVVAQIAQFTGDPDVALISTLTTIAIGLEAMWSRLVDRVSEQG